MKLLYSGAIGCDSETFKRLLLVGDEICFMDRPSVTFKNWGTVGVQSPFRQISSEGSPVKLSVYNVPEGPAQNLYSSYIDADLENSDFINVVCDGLKNDTVFASKFIQLDARYGDNITGKDVRNALVNNLEIISRISSTEIDTSLMYKINSEAGQRETLKLILTEGSIQVTMALLTASKHDICPVSDNPYFSRLLAMRTGHPKYIGGTATLAPFLGLEFAKAVIPDQVLQKIEITDVLAYRTKTKDLYDAWAIDLNKIVAELNDIESVNTSEVISKLIATELMPKIQTYRNEMISARDNLFGELIKKVSFWEFPTLSIAYFTDLGINGGILAFLAAIRGAIPPVVDYINAKNNTQRTHAVSYLVGLTK